MASLPPGSSAKVRTTVIMEGFIIMDICQEYAAVAQGRIDVYRLLARLYRVEVDEGLIASMKSLECSEKDAGDAWSKGCALVRGFAMKPGLDAVTNLAVDYARTFIGAGIADGKAAFPYESVYTSPEHLIMQEARDSVYSLYLSKGLIKAGEAVEPEDHLAYELEFMAYLCLEGKNAAEAGDEITVRASLVEQASFLHEHLTNWVDAFVKDVLAYAQTDFYRGVALMTSGFISDEHDLIASLTRDNA